MGRITNTFEKLKNENKKALITFVTAGDPDLETTKKIVREMDEKGSDIIELGIPYSDPIAEGPVIQRANSRALANGIKIKDIMTMVGEIRAEINAPLLYLLYFNCILQYGVENFFKDCKKVGIDGLIIPDLPFEEKNEIKQAALEYDVDIITLVAPTSKERIEKITADAQGFLYCISSLGVTGVRGEFNTDFEEFFSLINRYSKVPTALGFGISTPEHMKKLKKYSDGLIVGSAVVRQIENAKSPEEAVENTGRFVKSLRDALDRQSV